MNHMTKTDLYYDWSESLIYSLPGNRSQFKISFGISFLSDAWHLLNRSHTKLIDKISRNRQAASHHKMFYA